jgi:hypothetical protein
MAKASTRPFRPFTSRGAPTRHLGLFSPPMLIEGEDLALYRALADRLLAEVKPLDIVEEMLAHDVIYLEWDIFIYRRHKVEFMSAKRFDAFASLSGLLAKVRREFSDYEDKQLDELIDNWVYRDAKSPRESNDAVARAGLSRNVLMAATFFENIGDIGRIDELIAMAEARRNNALRELFRHRATLGRAMHHAIQQVEDRRSEKKAA